MAKYQIDVMRVGYAYKTIEVEAENEEQAKELALNDAHNHEFSENDADYQIV